MSDKPKVAILANFPYWLVDDNYPVFKGHYATWLPELYQAFGDSDDFEIHWVTLSKSITTAIHKEINNQHFHILPRARQMIGLYTAYCYDRLQIKSCIKSIQPDLVHAWGNEDCYALAAGDFRGKKLLSIQGILNYCCQYTYLGKYLQRHRLYEKRAIRRFKYITAESELACNIIRSVAPKSQVQLFEYAVEQSFFQSQRQRGEKKTFLFAGSNTTNKNVRLLINVFSQLEMAHLELKLAGIDAKELPPLPSNIKAIGRRNRDEMVELLQETWGLIAVSFAETGPTVVKEARVIGAPVIVSSGCGSKQYVVHGQSGFVVKANDEEAIKKAILHLAQSREANDQLGLYDLAHCQERLSRDAMLKNIKKIYQDIINQ